MTARMIPIKCASNNLSQITPDGCVQWDQDDIVSFGVRLETCWTIRYVYTKIINKHMPGLSNNGYKDMKQWEVALSREFR